MALYDEVLDLFTLRIINVGELRSVADALQERRFTSVRSADDHQQMWQNLARPCKAIIGSLGPPDLVTPWQEILFLARCC